MALTTTFLPLADARLESGDIVVATISGSKVIGLYHRYSQGSGLVVLHDDDEGAATPYMASGDYGLDDVRKITGEFRIEPLEGEGFGQLIKERPLPAGTLRLLPNGEMRLMLTDENDQRSWFNLTTPGYVQPGTVDLPADYARWRLVRLTTVGTQIERTTLAVHDYAA